jgi:hypothetical protein
MAKRRKEKESEEEDDFKIPKFDEKAFYKKEREKIKATVISFLFGVIIAIISFGFWALLSDSALQWTLVFLFGLFNGSWLRYLFNRFNIDETILERRGQFTNYAIYFLTWLFALIILINPPFYDGESPTINAISLPNIQETGGTVKIIAHVTDNNEIINNEVKFTLEYNDTIIIDEMIVLESQFFRYEFDNNEHIVGDYSYTIIAEDPSGKTNSFQGSFTYDNNAISIISSRFEDLRSGDSIVIDVDENIFSNNFRVYYTINNGSDINVNRDSKNNKERYETHPEYLGWKENKNHSIRVFVEVIYYFKNMPETFNNTVTDNTIYTFTTGTDSNIGQEQPLLSYNCSQGAKQKENTINYSLPCPRTIIVPGFELLFVCISLFIVVLYIKYKKKHVNF